MKDDQALREALEACLPFIDDAANVHELFPESAATKVCREAVQKARAALAAQPAEAPVLSDEYLEALIKACPLQGYALMTALPQTLTVDQLRSTLREWARALLQSHIDATDEQREARNITAAIKRAYAEGRKDEAIDRVIAASGGAPK